MHQYGQKNDRFLKSTSYYKVLAREESEHRLDAFLNQNL